jgi:serine/threonine-protein kinase
MRFASARSLAAWSAALLLSFVARAGGATEPRDAAAAEALFEEAKQLFEQGNYESACPKFDESYRLDPGTGVLFALALCHERSGKPATAWAEFIEVAGRANADHNAEREAAARERADALLPHLSFLVIRVDPATAGLPGLSVENDGVALRPAAFGSALPVDPGRHLVRAEAPDHKPWQATVEVGTVPGRQTITVPALDALPSKAAALPPVMAPPPERHGVVELTPMRIGAIALGGAGVASLALGGAALIRALDKKSSSDQSCTAAGCMPAGENDRLVAREAATWATVGAVSGAVLLGAGAVLWVLGKPPAPGPRVGRITVLIGPGRAAIAGEL